MSALQESCRRCGDSRAWLLRPVQEIDGVAPVEITDTQVCGWYEAVVCIGCGWTQFWAREYEPGRAPTTIDACLDCGGTSGWLVEQVPDLVGEGDSMPVGFRLARLRFKFSLMFSNGGWRGALAVRICSHCGAAAWLCRPEPAFPEDLRPPTLSPRPCRRCQGEQMLIDLEDHSAVEGAGGYRAVLAYQRPRLIGGPAFHRQGRLQLDVCRQCFAVEWQASSLDEVGEDPDKGVFRLDRGAPNNDGGGPYR